MSTHIIRGHAGELMAKEVAEALASGHGGLMFLLSNEKPPAISIVATQPVKVVDLNYIKRLRGHLDELIEYVEKEGGK